MQALLAYWVLYSLVSEYFSYLGTHHQVQVEVCSCSSVPVTLVHHRLWPATPSRPGLAFHFDLMEAMESLLLECQVAAKDFCAALSSRLPFLYRRVVSVFYYFLFGFFFYYYCKPCGGVEWNLDLQYFCPLEVRLRHDLMISSWSRAIMVKM